MQPITLTIPGKPIAKNRPRAANRGSRIFLYSDQKVEQAYVRDTVMIQLNNHKLFEGAIDLMAVFYMPIPKSTSKKKRDLMMSGKTYHVKKPDKDNLEKFICDCCNGIVWKDDAQVVHTDAWKIYSDNPRTELIIRELETLT